MTISVHGTVEPCAAGGEIDVTAVAVPADQRHGDRAERLDAGGALGSVHGAFHIHGATGVQVARLVLPSNRPTDRNGLAIAYRLRLALQKFRRVDPHDLVHLFAGERAVANEPFGQSLDPHKIISHELARPTTIGSFDNVAIAEFIKLTQHHFNLEAIITIAARTGTEHDYLCLCTRHECDDASPENLLGRDKSTVLLVEMLDFMWVTGDRERRAGVVSLDRHAATQHANKTTNHGMASFMNCSSEIVVV